MRRAAKVDANQPDIVKALRAVGCFVEPRLARIGGGVPDIMVATRGQWFIMEIKDGSLVPSKRELTPDETDWHNKVNGRAPVIIVESIDDALRAIGAK